MNGQSHAEFTYWLEGKPQAQAGWAKILNAVGEHATSIGEQTHLFGEAEFQTATRLPRYL